MGHKAMCEQYQQLVDAWTYHAVQGSAVAESAADLAAALYATAVAYGGGAISPLEDITPPAMYDDEILDACVLADSLAAGEYGDAALAKAAELAKAAANLLHYKSQQFAA